jgi:protein-disulfide isomerase
MNQLQQPVSSIDHIYGNQDANIELVEYGDFECPHCGRAYPMIKEIKQQLGKELKFVFRNFPLTKIHPNALSAAMATEAAALQGRFWEMHDIIFEHQHSLDPDNLLLLAGRIGLDLDRFKNDIHNEQLIGKVEKDFETGIRSGVNGTPSFFINGVKYEGEWSDGQLLQHLKKNKFNYL